MQRPPVERQLLAGAATFTRRSSREIERTDMATIQMDTEWDSREGKLEHALHEVAAHFGVTVRVLRNPWLRRGHAAVEWAGEADRLSAMLWNTYGLEEDEVKLTT